MNIVNAPKTVLLLAVITLTLSGCSFLNNTNNVTTTLTAADVINVNTQQQIALPLTVSQSLSKNAQSFSIELQPIQVADIEANALSADISYHAASGRKCRKIKLSSQLHSNDYTACQTNTEQWVLINPIKY